MALTPWALIAILDRRDGVFAVVAGLATACKEPGILLAAPAFMACVIDRRKGWGWVTPPLVLAAWAGIHYLETGWALASSERLPDSVLGWIRDVGTVAWIVLGEQGRFLLIPAAIWGALKAPRRRGLAIVGIHVLTQIGFFGTLNFLGGLDRLDAHTHVRYLIPGMLGACALAVALFPWNSGIVAILGLVFLHRPSKHGPESSLYGLDIARAVQAAEIPEGAWVGSYAWTQLTRPYAGVVDEPRDDLRVYRFGTAPEEIDGPIVEVCEGEPLGRLQELDLVEVDRFEVRHAWVRILERR